MVFGRFWTWYSSALVRHPLRTNAVSALVIATLGDLTAQTLEAKYHPKLSHIKRQKAKDEDQLHHHLPLHPHTKQNFHIAHQQNHNPAQVNIANHTERNSNSKSSNPNSADTSSQASSTASAAPASATSSSLVPVSNSAALSNPILASTATAITANSSSSSTQSSTTSSSASSSPSSSSNLPGSGGVSVSSGPLAVVPSASPPVFPSLFSPIIDFFAPIEYRGDRLASLALWGGFQAIPMHYWFAFLDRAFPSRALPSVLKKVAINQICYAPLLNGAFFGYTIACETGLVKTTDRQEFWQRYKERIAADLLPTTQRSVMVWGSFHILNFTFFPPHVRVVASSILGMFWIAYLSLVGHDDGFEQ